MARLNAERMYPVRTHEGAAGQRVEAHREAAARGALLPALGGCLAFYEKGDGIARRIAELVVRAKPEHLAALAVEAREQMQLRHVPLFLARELARRKRAGTLVAEVLERVIQHPDELAEFVALYWRVRREPLSAGAKRGLARAFAKFDAYQLAKYDRKGSVRLRDVLFLCHAKPKDRGQAILWKRLVEDTLEPPDTWEVALSAGKDKRETWERLLREGKLGGMAVLRNLRLMLAAGVPPPPVAARLERGIPRALPFRFVTAARHSPTLEEGLETSVEDRPGARCSGRS
jgi:60 kDa SS-A/Ro ribonucleoprotein